MKVAAPKLLFTSGGYEFFDDGSVITDTPGLWRAEWKLASSGEIAWRIIFKSHPNITGSYASAPQGVQDAYCAYLAKLVVWE